MQEEKGLSCAGRSRWEGNRKKPVEEERARM
jgi:hypothetical protein